MMSPAVQIFAVIFLAWFSASVDAYGNGQVTDACITMMPVHGAPAQTTSSPYILNLSKTTYSPGENIIVTLTSSSGATQFKGFLIQARSGSNTTPLGSFQTSSNAQTLVCTTTASSVSHTSSSGKTSLQVTWVAPTSITADIQIKATIVQTEKVFWTNVGSATLSYMAVPSTTNSSTTATSATSSSTAGTTNTSATSSSTVRTATIFATSSSTTQNFQAFLMFCVVVPFLSWYNECW